MALTDNLIAAWELDEASGSRADSHGSQTLTDNNTVGAGAGLVHANAASFVRANSEYLSRASEAALQTGDIDFTFEMWFRIPTGSMPSDLGGNVQFVTKDVDSPASARDYTIDAPTTDQVRFYLGGGGGGGGIVTSAVTLSPDTWYQAVCWHDSTADTLSIRINDATTTSAIDGSVFDVSVAEFRIGARAYSGAEQYFDGRIGPVRFWKRVLTGGEITQLYNGGAGLAYSSFGGSVPIPQRRLQFMPYHSHMRS